jgi:hypothetical protein
LQFLSLDGKLNRLPEKGAGAGGQATERTDMTSGEFQPTLPFDDDDRDRAGPGVKPDWSKPSGAKAPAPFDSFDPAGMEDRPPPPPSFVRNLSTFLGAEMFPVLEKPDLPWRWNRHPGSGVLTLPWLRSWAFKRNGSRGDRHDLQDQVIVGSWKIEPGPLSWWIAAAEATATGALERERTLCRLQGRDPAPIPRGFKVGLLPPRQNWMEPPGPNVCLLIAGSPTAFPPLDPDQAAAYARSAQRLALRSA